jgi:hypothetical protein
LAETSREHALQQFGGAMATALIGWGRKLGINVSDPARRPLPRPEPQRIVLRAIGSKAPDLLPRLACELVEDLYRARLVSLPYDLDRASHRVDVSRA